MRNRGATFVVYGLVSPGGDVPVREYEYRRKTRRACRPLHCLPSRPTERGRNHREPEWRSTGLDRHRRRRAGRALQSGGP